MTSSVPAQDARRRVPPGGPLVSQNRRHAKGRLPAGYAHGPSRIMVDNGTAPCVSAASIFAKVNRDAVIADMGDVGSGYPSDPKTVKWLQAIIDAKKPFPAGVRLSGIHCTVSDGHSSACVSTMS